MEVVPVVVGPAEFYQALQQQNVAAVHVAWQPPPEQVTVALESILGKGERLVRIEKANRAALERLLAANCRLTDLRPARDVVPGMEGRILLHAGPPLTWETACGPMRGALTGAAMYEGWARSLGDAAALLQRGEIRLEPCHQHDAVGPMAGVISPSMPVFVVRNEAFGNHAFSNMNEGLGKVLRYGANDGGVIARLRWLADEMAPVLAAAIRRADGIDLTGLMAQAVHMGDELHNRNKAATTLFTRAIAPPLLEVASRRPESAGTAAAILRYLGETDVFFLNLAMASCKAALDAAHGIADSTLVTAMARNGTEFGIRVSGTGKAWFTASAPRIQGLYFPGFSEADANPDLGDSAITETGGLGAFALAAAPAISQFIGGSPSEGRHITEEMYSITLAQHPRFTIPALDFRGTPVGVDVFRTARTRVAPMLDTGIAHREAGVGQIGAGVVQVPIEPFDSALVEIAKRP